MAQRSILMITGSPRRGGNRTVLANAFIEGAKSGGHSVRVFDAARTPRARLPGLQCLLVSRAHACVFEDGFRELAPLLAEADVLALASPLYWFVFSAQLKAALDKFYAFMEPRTKKKPILKEAVLLMTAWYSRPEAYCGAIGTYRETCRYLGLRDRGIITVASVYDVGAIAGNDALKQARELGASL